MYLMEDKIKVFCDINNIASYEKYVAFWQYLESKNNLSQCLTYSVYDYLIQWLRDMRRWEIDEEHFFQLWDISGEKIVKSPRPYLSAIQVILQDVQKNTLYVIDSPSKIAFVSRWWDFAELEKTLSVHWSCIYVIS